MGKKEQKQDNLKKEARKAAKQVEKDDRLKKPTTAYWRWMNANRAKIEEAAGSKSVGAVGAKAGEMWKNLPASEKKPFEEEAAKAKKEYDDYVNSDEGKAALCEYKNAAKEAKTAVLGDAQASRKRKADAIAAGA